MTPRKVLRTRLGIEDGSVNPNAPEVTDEEILNILRYEKEKENGEDELTTSEIAEQLPIGSKQTHNRLKKLKEDDRVEKRRAGRADMWRLAPEEPEVVVNPDLGPVIKQSSRARKKARDVKRKGMYFCAGGFILLIIGMTLWISEITLFSSSTAAFLAFGYSSGIVGAFIVMVGIVLRLAGLVAPRFAEYFLLE